MPTNERMDKDGKTYGHLLSLNDGETWFHLVIDQPEWKVFENDTHRIEVLAKKPLRDSKLMFYKGDKGDTKVAAVELALHITKK